MNVCVRFAPSPTGQLHIGGVRTALYNFLFAKNNNGKFLVRIEDTDKHRSKQEYTDQICNSLSWLGLNWDDELIFQSLRTARYKHVIDNLIKQDRAYYCFSSKDELEKIRVKTGSHQYPGIWRDRSTKEVTTELIKGRPYTIRLRSPKSGYTIVDDIIYGNIKISNSELDDFILMRSDGSPVYNLVASVDDHDMKISHVIRGEDHISNTPKQILIYNALNWSLPKFAHLPMINGFDGKRLSKRHGATGVQTYRDEGYQPSALLNYIAFLGWNPGTDEEIMDLNQLISNFRLEKVNKKSAIFDPKKLNWISRQHLLIQPTDDIFKAVRNIYSEWGRSRNNDYCCKVIDILKQRSKSLDDLIQQSEYFFYNPTSFMRHGKLNLEGNVDRVIPLLRDKLNDLSIWENASIEKEFKNLINDENLKLAEIMKHVRYIICGVMNGPSLYDVMVLLGRKSCIDRFDYAIELQGETNS
tara:strand:- start:486 stop:1895 length:1410 start_codon:yes stop_codon:yes gene_type:complete